METTYGNTKRSIDAMMEFKRFKQEVADVVKKGGIAWIPAFALDRTQKVLYLISKAKKEGIIPENIPIFCPSPTAANITNIYQSELDKKEGWFKSDLYQESNVFAYHQQKLPKEIPQPSILVTTSGMMDAAFSDNLSQTLLPNALITVFLVGYQDPGTPGGQLKAGQTSVQWDGKQIEVNANVRDFKVFSAHADAQDLEKWLSNQNKQTTKIYLVHGEKSALFAQKKSLENLGFQNVKVPHEGEELDFSQHSK
jgi:metallo-beta-lactamase family protein